jgi:hypothetical protein
MEISRWENWITGSAVYMLKTQYLTPHSISISYVHFSHILPHKQTDKTKSGAFPGYKHYQFKHTF